MPTPRFKSFKMTYGDHVMVVFYAGRNAAGMKKDAEEQFQIAYGSLALHEGEGEEEFYNGRESFFNNAIADYKEQGFDLRYTENLKDIGKRWVLTRTAKQEDEADAVFGHNGGAGIPPSLQGDEAESIVIANGGLGSGHHHREHVMEAAREIVEAGAAAAPAPEPDQFENVPPVTIEPGEASPDQEPATDRQKHEIVPPGSGTRITFDTEGDPDWGGQPVPEGYRRIDDVAEVGDKANPPEHPADNTPDYIDDQFQRTETQQAGAFNAEELSSSVVEVDPNSKREVEEAPVDYDTLEDLIPEEDIIGRPQYDSTLVDTSQLTNEPGEQVEVGLPYTDGELTRGDARYAHEDGGVQAASGDPERREHEGKVTERNQDEIDTGKLRQPDNMRKEMEELRGNPNTADQKKDDNGGKKTSGIHTIPQRGRRSNATFGVVI